MEHPCYTNVNPAAEAKRYTSEKVQVRKVTLIYDWLDPDRDVESWFRRVPYRLEEGPKGRSWIVRYFEFRTKAHPVPEMGFIGDLWICWDARDPSVWFKVEEMTWERWGGCVSSIRERMVAKHPFLDKAYLWFDPIDFFLLGGEGRSYERFSLRWERLHRIRRIAPTSRIVDPDCEVPLGKVFPNPVYLPTMRTIVEAMCPYMPQFIPTPRNVPTASSVDRGEGSDRAVVAGTSRIQVRGLHEPLPHEGIAIGSDVEIEWDWWGSSDNEAKGETTEVESSQPLSLSVTRTPPPVSSPRQLRYHPYRPTSISPETRFTKFKPPRRYTQGTLNPENCPGNPCNTPASSFSSTSTVVGSNPSPVLTDNGDSVVSLQERGFSPQGWAPRLRKLSQRTLLGIVTVLREENYNQSGPCILIPPEDYEVRDNLVAAELPVPILDLGTRASHKIGRLLYRDGFIGSGIILLNGCNEGEGM